MKDRTARIWVVLAAGVGIVSLVGWAEIAAYGAWLRFNGLAAPVPATGHVLPAQGPIGLVYVTQGQHLWLDQAWLPFFAVGLLALAVIWGLALLRPGSLDLVPWGRKGTLIIQAAWLAFVGLQVLGDHLMLFSTQNAWDLPPSFDPAMPEPIRWIAEASLLACIAALAVAGVHRWKGGSRKRSRS